VTGKESHVPEQDTLNKKNSDVTGQKKCVDTRAKELLKRTLGRKRRVRLAVNKRGETVLRVGTQEGAKPGNCRDTKNPA